MVASCSLQSSVGRMMCCVLNRFERYYRAQGVVAGGAAELAALLSSCRAGLPSVFRVVTTR